MKLLRADWTMGILVFEKTQMVSPEIHEERAFVRKKLYEISKRVTLKRAVKATLSLPYRLLRVSMEKEPLRRQTLFENAISDIIDNADVYRLSQHRLATDDHSQGEAFRS
jgi:hypothetical protein